MEAAWKAVLFATCHLYHEVSRQAAQYARPWFPRSESKTCLQSDHAHLDRMDLHACRHGVARLWEGMAAC